MSANVYGVTEIVGDLRRMVWIAAIGVGIARASTTLRGLDWF
jgi:flavin-binding protein dodecin